MAWVTKSSEEHYDAPQEPQRVYTRSEKAKNWWHYYKWVVLVVALLIVCGAWLVHDILSNEEADYQVGWVAGYSLPDETAAALQTTLAQYGEDRNGDGQVTVQINSSDVETGFYATGILLYAADPDEGEVPYTYLVLENGPEWIRPASSAVGKLATFDLIAAVGDVDNVTATIDPDSIGRGRWWSSLSPEPR